MGDNVDLLVRVWLKRKKPPQAYLNWLRQKVRDLRATGIGEGIKGRKYNLQDGC